MALAIVTAVLLTSILSGIFGMGGGMLLMVVYAALLSAPAAMVLHGLTQLCANGTRAWLLLRHVRWSTARRYLLGVLLASGLCAWVGLIVDAGVMLIALGALPLVSAAIPRSRLALDPHHTPSVMLCGAAAGTVQLISGVAGPLLDLLFARSELDRHAVVGTKAAIQVAMHTVKVVYFVSLARAAAWDPALSPWLLLPIVAAAMLGTRLGRGALDRLGEARFRVYADRLLIAIGVLLLARGVALS
ncbi:MAG: sulfite exporter TauE/SafE family protein [Myxococcales bacterium]|nr:sulfite exporter TauE/SafE family protein [Myxococcales bacterium]